MGKKINVGDVVVVRTEAFGHVVYGALGLVVYVSTTFCKVQHGWLVLIYRRSELINLGPL